MVISILIINAIVLIENDDITIIIVIITIIEEIIIVNGIIADSCSRNGGNDSFGIGNGGGNHFNPRNNIISLNNMNTGRGG